MVLHSGSDVHVPDLEVASLERCLFKFLTRLEPGRVAVLCIPRTVPASFGESSVTGAQPRPWLIGWLRAVAIRLRGCKVLFAVWLFTGRVAPLALNYKETPRRGLFNDTPTGQPKGLLPCYL